MQKGAAGQKKCTLCLAMILLKILQVRELVYLHPQIYVIFVVQFSK